jgi:histidinol dehydrogenase
MSNIRVLKSSDPSFQTELEQLLAWDSVSDSTIATVVSEIISTVRSDGDNAILEYTRRFDGWQAQSIAELKIERDEMEAALGQIEPDQREALEYAANRVNTYAEKQKTESWKFQDDDGTWLGQQVTPMDRVGLYVPGGKAAYPSSVIMNAIPAKVAGVSELVMVCPTPAGERNPLVLAAAFIAGVDVAYAIGGAQAIAALAYGTESIAGVDKIVGPGNIYVATAKRAVFGQVGIDMVAGPSEILILSDGKTNPDWIAMDLFSQAEHDEDAQSILVTPDSDHIEDVKASIARLLPGMERKEIIAKALAERGALIQVVDLDEGISLANHIAPEHLELSIDNAENYAKRVRHAGAIFMGRDTSEPLGDYCAGPNHVLPTSRTARFSSPLGVYDFQKRSSLIMASKEGARTLGANAAILARGEGLTAHARSAEYRFKKD